MRCIIGADSVFYLQVIEFLRVASVQIADKRVSPG